MITFKFGDTVRLGALIDALESFDPETSVRFDFGGFLPANVASSRGWYEQLAVGYTDQRTNTGASHTVEKLIDKLRAAVGATFEGYKGGQFVMNRSTPVWCDNWGHWSNTGIVGLRQIGEHSVIIETAYVET